MELDEVSVEVRFDVGVDGAVNLFALLDQVAQRFPDLGAVYHGRQRCCTWAQLRDRALRLAGSIRQHYPTGARIAIASENRPEIVELMFGIWAAECVAVPINFKLDPRDDPDPRRRGGLARLRVPDDRRPSSSAEFFFFFG